MNNVSAISVKRKSNETNSTQGITDARISKKICNSMIAKPALPFDEIVNEEAVEIINHLSISDRSSTPGSHPVCDFLTEPIVSLLLDLMSGKTSNRGICYFYGPGKNGKSCFVRILQDTFRYAYISTRFFRGEISDIKGMDPKPQILIVAEPDQEMLDLYMDKKNLEIIESLNIPIIMMGNILPRSFNNILERNEEQPNKYGFEVFEFKNEYVNLDSPQLNCF